MIFRYKHITPSKTTPEVKKLSYEELNAIQEMSLRILKGRYHHHYINYYKSVIEAVRIELDERIMNKIFIVY